MTSPTANPTRRINRLLAAADSARSGLRREGDEFRPLGKKAARTRNALLRAAYEQFVAQGYRNTSVQDIHEAAGVSIGTFYQYFRDKADVTATIVGETIVQAAGEIFPALDLTDGAPSRDRTVEGFVRYYAQTADFQQVWEEVTHFDADLSHLRWELTSIIEAGLRDRIRSGQDAGSVDASLDPEATARALTAMVERHCYRTFVVEKRGDEAVESTVDTLADLWGKVLAPPGG